MKTIIPVLVALVLVGCQCGTNPNQNQVGALPSSCEVAPVAAPQNPCAVAAPAPSACGDLPAEALPGETWCCVPVPVAAAAPERVCVKPECVHAVSVPAEYETVTEQVLVCPARTEWQEVTCQQAGSDKCYRLVEIPATYETRTRQRLVREAYQKMEYEAAQYQDIAGAAPAPIYRWKKFDSCESAPANAAAVYVVPPESAVPAPASSSTPTDATPPAMQK